MNDRDRKRFQSSMTWFNQFFDGLRQIFLLVVDQMPAELLPEGFTANAENFYYQAQKAMPTIPPYYAMLLPLRQAAVQLIAICDARLISKGEVFHSEPCMVVMAHSRPEKYAWVDEFALKMLKAQELEQIRIENNTVWGKLTGKYPADFSAFQVEYDHFGDIRNPPEAVSQWIVEPLVANLAKGFELPAEQVQVTGS